MSQRKGRFTAVVFGAGVAGLTAAHELAERGFKVWVLEPQLDPTDERGGARVGGLAATQWCEVPERASAPIRALPLSWLPERVFFMEGSTEPCSGQGAALERLAKFCEAGHVYLVGARDAGEPETIQEPAGGEERRLALARAEALGRALPEGRSTCLAIDDDVRDDRSPPDTRRVVYVRATREVLEGEHGYRFFPAFYRHLLQTMRRIPWLVETRRPDRELAFRREQLLYIQSQADPERLALPPLDESSLGREFDPTGRTAFDNLVPLEHHAVATAGRPVRPLRRNRPTSASDIADILRELSVGLELEPRDLLFFSEKLWKLMTSGDRRRRALESVSWWSYLEAERFGPRMREALQRWPQALAGLRASEGDARTHGEVTIQLVLDQLREGWTDGSLNGPTSSAWLDPWKLYLERKQGVRFVRGALERLELWDGRLRPVVSYLRSDVPEALDTALPPLDVEQVDFFVVAVPLERLDSLLPPATVEAARAQPGLAGREDLLALGALAREAATPNTGLYRDYVGVQYHLEQDVRWIEGHIYLADSAWSVSLISKVDLRLERPGRNERMRGLVSAIIGTLDEPSPETGKTARASTPDEIALEVWRQIRGALPDLPQRPVSYHLDDSLRFPPGGPARVENRYFVNAERRPLPGRLDPERGYQAVGDAVVFCGAHMATYTRLSSMEAANESARHAVNGILDALRRSDQGDRLGSPCRVWSMVEREPRDLGPLRRLDDELFARGLPHAGDILGFSDISTILGGG